MVGEGREEGIGGGRERERRRRKGEEGGKVGRRKEKVKGEAKMIVRK